MSIGLYAPRRNLRTGAGRVEHRVTWTEYYQRPESVVFGKRGFRTLISRKKEHMQRIGFLFVDTLIATSAFAIDGVVLINQSTVTAAGGFPYMITKTGSYKRREM